MEQKIEEDNLQHTYGKSLIDLEFFSVTKNLCGPFNHFEVLVGTCDVASWFGILKQKRNFSRKPKVYTSEKILNFSNSTGDTNRVK